MTLINKTPDPIMLNILAFAANPQAPATNKKFKRLTDTAIEKFAKFLFDETRFEVHRWIHAKGLPKRSKDLHSLFTSLVRKAAYFDINIEEFKKLGAYLNAKGYFAIDNAIKARLSDLNLIDVWPILKEALEKVGRPVAGPVVGLQAIKKYFAEHEADFAQIKELNLHMLHDDGEKSVPDEIFQKIPNLVKFEDYHRTSRCPAADYGSQWKELREFRIIDFDLRCLPKGFGNQWPKLQKITLNAPLLTHLPEDFCSTCPDVTSFSVGASFKITPDKVPERLRKVTRCTLINQHINKILLFCFLCVILYRWEEFLKPFSFVLKR